MKELNCWVRYSSIILLLAHLTRYGLYRFQQPLRIDWHRTNRLMVPAPPFPFRVLFIANYSGTTRKFLPILMYTAIILHAQKTTQS